MVSSELSHHTVTPLTMELKLWYAVIFSGFGKIISNGQFVRRGHFYSRS